MENVPDTDCVDLFIIAIMQMLRKIPYIEAFIISRAGASWNVYDGPIYCNSGRNHVFCLPYPHLIIYMDWGGGGRPTSASVTPTPAKKKTGSRGLALSRNLFTCLLRKCMMIVGRI